MIYNLDYMGFGFMSIALLWKDEKNERKDPRSLILLREPSLGEGIRCHQLTIHIKNRGPRNVN